MKKFIQLNNFWILGFFTAFIYSCNTKHRVWVGENNEQKIFNLKYGEEKKQKMDIFLPSNYSAETPVVLIVHGGAWKLGRKENMIKIQKFLHENNLPTANINYRLVKKKKNLTHKNQLEDIAAAIGKFNNFSEKTQLSKDNFVILGESAGAHLALLYGYKNPGHIKKIISLSGPTDFYSETYLNSNYSKYSSPTIEDVVGVQFNRENLSEEFKKASPIANVSDVPTLIFQGEKDFLVHKNQGLKLDSVLTSKGIEHRLIFMENTGHVPRFWSKKKRDSLIFPAILDWIEK